MESFKGTPITVPLVFVWFFLYMLDFWGNWTMSGWSSMLWSSTAVYIPLRFPDVYNEKRRHTPERNTKSKIQLGAKVRWYLMSPPSGRLGSMRMICVDFPHHLHLDDCFCRWRKLFSEAISEWFCALAFHGVGCRRMYVSLFPSSRTK